MPHHRPEPPSSALPPWAVCQALACRATGWKSARFRVGCCCPPAPPVGATPIRPITGRPSLPPSSSTRRPVGVPRGPLSPHGEGDGLTTFRVRTRMGQAPPLRRWHVCLRQGKGEPLHPATHRLVQ